MKNYYLSIKNEDYDSILAKLKDSLKSDSKEFIITANAEIFMQALSNPDLEEIITNKDHLVIADGISIIKTAKYFNINLNRKIAGVEICEDLLNYAAEKKLSTFVYGSKEEALNLLKNKYSEIPFIGLKNGYDNSEEQIQKEILSLKPDLVIVALGVPRQERFINAIYKSATKGIFIGVGGSVDVISGYKKRAPKFFRKLNIEWLYRIIKEPKRIKRFIENNIKLLFIAKKTSKNEFNRNMKINKEG